MPGVGDLRIKKQPGVLDREGERRNFVKGPEAVYRGLERQGEHLGPLAAASLEVRGGSPLPGT